MLRRSPLRRVPMSKSAPRRAAGGDREYLAWIRTLPCIVCRHLDLAQMSPTDAHHFGPRGLSQKVADDQAIPLCHHDHHIFGATSAHVLGRNFGTHHGIDVPTVIAWLRSQYPSRNLC